MNNRDRLDEAVERARSSLEKQYGKNQNDYYGLVFFEHVLKIDREQALNQLAFGNHDLGIDGFHFDEEQETFRVFQFKNSASVRLFNQSLVSLIEKGVPAVFGDLVAGPEHQRIVDNVRAAISRHKEDIAQVTIDFVFRGAAEDVEDSAAIASLKERLEESAWLLETFFEEPIPLMARFHRFDEISPAAPAQDRFKIRLLDCVEFEDGGMHMHVGFLPLMDLYGIRASLGGGF